MMNKAITELSQEQRDQLQLYPYDMMCFYSKDISTGNTYCNIFNNEDNSYVYMIDGEFRSNPISDLLKNMFGDNPLEVIISRDEYEWSKIK